MAFLLSSGNVVDYLIDRRLLSSQDRAAAQVTEKEYRNFNLLVRLESGACWLVKQERMDPERNRSCGFWSEQKIDDLFQAFPDLSHLRPLTSEVLYFDPENFILVLRYFPDFVDLSHFYRGHQHLYFPVAIAEVLGRTLGTLHRQTIDQAIYRSFLSQGIDSDRNIAKPPSFLRGLERFGPGLFSKVSTDGIEFWRLYQRYDSLHQAVAEIAASYESCCLTHNDLEFRNILVQSSWNDETNADTAFAAAGLKLIDWEFFRWGDPAHDLAIVLSSYLSVWLESLVVSKAIPMQTALRLAATPLERLQPSMIALVQSYLNSFPAILSHQPQFLKRVVQFTGLVLIKQIQGRMERLHPFDNTCLCTLQVAKMLLCHPEQSRLEILGAEVMLPNAVFA